MEKPAKTTKAHKPTDLTATEKAQLELGKKLQAMFEMGYVNKRMAITMSFAKGVASGFGALVGATIVLALVLWFLSFFEEVPFLGPISDAIESALRTGEPPEDLQIIPKPSQ